MCGNTQKMGKFMKNSKSSLCFFTNQNPAFDLIALNLFAKING